MEGQRTGGYPSYPYGGYSQYDAYSTYTYTQAQQTQTTPPQADAIKQESGTPAPPPPPPPPQPQATQLPPLPPALTPEQQQAQAWAQYYQQQAAAQAAYYPNAYANPQGAYAGANGQQQQQQPQQQAAQYYQGAYYPGYGYSPYAYGAAYQQYQQQAAAPQQQSQQQQQQQQQNGQAANYHQQKAAPTLTDPRLRGVASTNKAATVAATTSASTPQGGAPKRKSRFSAARETSSDSMDIDEEGPAKKDKPAASGVVDKAGIPAALSLWIERCFVHVRGDVRAEARLKPKLTEYIKGYAERGMLASVDWDKEPVLKPPPSPEPERYNGGGSRRRGRSEYSDDEGSTGSSEEGSYGTYGPASAAGRGRYGKQTQKGRSNQQQGKRAKKDDQQQEQKMSKKAIAQYQHDERANQRRLQRFKQDGWKPRRVGTMEKYEDDGDWDPSKAKPIIGTCQELEKEYFRLNEVPASDSVRPQPVLRRALDRLKERFGGTAEDQRAADYDNYLCSQLKAIRQDLLVQHLRNEFAVEVYETHARIALECRDLNEYNQCQTQLMEHYREGLSGSVFEFHAYRILYYVYLQSNAKYQDGDAGITRILAELSAQEFKDAAVVHALKVRKAVALGNYHSLGRLYQTAPNMGAYIMDHFMDQLRVKALQTMMKGYRPTISVEFVQQELAFFDHATCLDFLKKVGAVFSDPDSEKLIDAKQTKVDPSGLGRRALM